MYRVPANRNHLEAQFCIGVDYLQGNGVEENYDIALEWFHRAASENYAPAQDIIGCMYSYGYGVEQDYSRAFEWCEKAANQSYDKGQLNIAIMYMKGYGAEQDFAKATEWFQKAANLGNAEAQYELGDMYSKGIGIEIDLDKAYYWFGKAADLGHAEAIVHLHKLSENNLNIKSDTTLPNVKNIDNYIEKSEVSQKYAVSFKKFFDSHFLDESKKYPMNTGGIFFFENMTSEQISKLGKIGNEILQKTDYQIDIGYANFVIDTSMTNNFSAGLFLHLDDSKFTIHIKNIFKDWERVNEVEEAYYCESSKNLFINDYEFNMFDDSARFYAQRLAECINAYLKQNDEKEIDQEVISNSDLVTDALHDIEGRLTEIKEKMQSLQTELAA